jgi:hypothetical protein
MASTNGARGKEGATQQTAPLHGNELENKIVALEKRLWSGDADDIAQLEAVDFEVIKHAHRYHRADEIAAANDAKFALVSMDDVQVRMLGPDVALLTYHATQKGSFRGTDVPPSLYFGSLWVKREGVWKNVFLEENLPDAFTDTYKPANSSALHLPQAESTKIPGN